MPVDIKCGEDCVSQNAPCFALGTHAILVTGRNAAKASGAQADVTAVLDSLGIGYTVYDKIGENPLLSVCFDGGQIAHAAGADFVIGIGGGSAMDAAKAVAAFGANPEMDPMGVYSTDRAPSLPMILIPTTAGTGSEANPYAVMTLDGEGKKKSFSDRVSGYAKYAFLDAKYMDTLPERNTVSCALDAFSHCAESYLSPKSDDVSRLFAGYGAKVLYAFLRDHEPGAPISREQKEGLLYASCAAGMAINATGTGFPHPLGYNLTLDRGIPHGAACGIFYREYLSYNEKADLPLCEAFYRTVGATGEEIKSVIPARAAVDVTLSEEEIASYVDKVKSAGNFVNSPYVIDPAEMADIYRRLFGKA